MIGIGPRNPAVSERGLGHRYETGEVIQLKIMPEYKQDTETPVNPGQPFGEPGSDEGEGIDFLHFWVVLWKGKWLILAALVFSILLGQAYCFLATPGYKADALIQVEKEAKTLATGLDELASQYDSEASTGAEMEILQSRMVLGKVVEYLHLDVQVLPEYLPLLGAPIARRYKSPDEAVSEPWFGLSDYAWGGEAIAVETLIVPDDLLGVSLTLVVGEANRFVLLDPAERILLDGQVGQRVQRDMGAGQSVQLFISAMKARPGTRFALRRTSQLAAIRAVQESLVVKEKGQSGVLELTFSGDEPAAVEKILNAIATVYLRQNVERRSEEAEKRLEFLEQQLPSMRERLDTSEKAYNAYRQTQGSVDLEAETRALLDQIVTLESELRVLDLKRAELRLKYMPSHPQVIAMDREIGQTKSTLDELNGKTNRLPATQQEMLRFERDVKVDTELYTTLLNNLQELRVAKAGTIGTVRIIDHAFKPLSPESPQPVLVRALALMGGLFLGVGLVFMRNALHAGVEDPDRVEEALALPVYATIPHCEEQSRLVRKRWGRRNKGSSSRDTAVLVAHEEKNALAVESLRSLRTAMHFALLNARSNSILIVGPRPQIGKSFISANLSVVFAQSGKRVLLIDADMRLGHLHRYFGMTAAPGLSDYISGKDMEVSAVIQPTLVEGLDVVPTGKLPPNPSELLMHERFAFLLRQVEELYELVLIDSPPVLAATDAAIMGQLTGAALMVVKSSVHPMRELRDTAKRLRHNGVNLRGIIFNDVPPATRGYGYGYGKYVYHYSYKQNRPAA